MQALDFLILLLHSKLKINGFESLDFVLEFKNNSLIISTLNRSNTVLFKIRIPDFESDKSGNYIVKLKDLNNCNYVAYEPNEYDKRYVDAVTTFDKILFETEDYTESIITDLEPYLSFTDKTMLMDVRGKSGLYNIQYLNSILLYNPSVLCFKLKDDKPLMIHYKWYDVDFYACIADINHDELKADINYNI